MNWILIGIGIFIIAFVSLGAIRSQQINEHNQLGQELTLAQAKVKTFQLNQLSARKAELEYQLSQNRVEFEAAEAKLSNTIGSIATSSILFDIAAACGVEVTEISSPGIASAGLGGVTCPVLSLNTQVEGNLPNLISFITMLNNELTTGFVKSVDITIPETAGEEEEPERTSANIQLVLYTDQGS